jgi:hypothetical protein
MGIESNQVGRRVSLCPALPRIAPARHTDPSVRFGVLHDVRPPSQGLGFPTPEVPTDHLLRKAHLPICFCVPSHRGYGATAALTTLSTKYG